MTNYKLIIRYDGTGYRGWEHQPGEDKTIQGKLETAVIRMLNPSGVGSDSGDSLGSFEGEIPDFISAGRTDGGVSAEGMCANVKLETSLSCIQIRDSLNRNLPDDICVISVEKAGDRFHARYNATGKTYRYTCYAGELKPVFESIDIEEKEGFISFTYHGNGFLQYMVRIMTGTLIEVGLGKRTPESVSEVLEAKDRAAAGFTAPARGLKLVSVDYD